MQLKSEFWRAWVSEVRCCRSCGRPPFKRFPPLFLAGVSSSSFFFFLAVLLVSVLAEHKLPRQELRVFVVHFEPPRGLVIIHVQTRQELLQPHRFVVVVLVAVACLIGLFAGLLVRGSGASSIGGYSSIRSSIHTVWPLPSSGPLSPCTRLVLVQVHVTPHFFVRLELLQKYFVVVALPLLRLQGFLARAGPRLPLPRLVHFELLQGPTALLAAGAVHLAHDDHVGQGSSLGHVLHGRVSLAPLRHRQVVAQHRVPAPDEVAEVRVAAEAHVVAAQVRRPRYLNQRQPPPFPRPPYAARRFRWGQHRLTPKHDILSELGRRHECFKLGLRLGVGFRVEELPLGGHGVHQVHQRGDALDQHQRADVPELAGEFGRQHHQVVFAQRRHDH
mmetsp:Transcript_22446/g.41115  ORF Transcript_22446/g.41115 Transcript_22446/m.41115 type:complete len:388 (-) Transcript_22446:828-1991(-)